MNASTLVNVLKCHARLHCRAARGLACMTLLFAAAILTGCDTQAGGPLGPFDPNNPNPNPQPNPPVNEVFAPGTYIFALKPDPIEGFTFTNSGATMEHWVFRPPMAQGRAFCGGAVLNDRIYAIGGNTAGLAELATAEVLDLPGTGTWTPIAALSAPRTGIAAAAANGKIYAIGGFRTGVPLVGTNEEYDPVANTWTPRAPNPTPRAYAAAVTVNDKIYLIGGSTIVNNLFTDSTSVDEYDPANDTWTPKAPLPVGLSTHAAAELDGKIHVVINATHVEYDPATNVWTPRKPMPTSRDRLGAFSWNGKFYAVGGRLAGGVVTGVVEEYQPQFDGWETRLSPSVTTQRHSFGFAAIGPSFYRFGGTTPGQGGSFGDMITMEYFAHTDVFPFRKN
ncbi:MAG TPA: kelch repeat-containing protein [Phycisphaerae bacterium]|nr:kelch repeat-containing protein [Phycisphaerae bacterium]